MKLAEQELVEILRPPQSEPKKPLRKLVEAVKSLEEPVQTESHELYQELKNTPVSQGTP